MRYTSGGSAAVDSSCVGAIGGLEPRTASRRLVEGVPQRVCSREQIVRGRFQRSREVIGKHQRGRILQRPEDHPARVAQQGVALPFGLQYPPGRKYLYILI